MNIPFRGSHELCVDGFDLLLRYKPVIAASLRSWIIRRTFDFLSVNQSIKAAVNEHIFADVIECSTSSIADVLGLFRLVDESLENCPDDSTK